MKINQSRPVNQVRGVQRYTADGTARTAEPGGVREVSDSASIMGIPAEEMTPKVRQAIMTLMEEVDRMRKELDRAQQRIQELEQLADRDSLVPMANRRAFVRELSRMISFAERYEVPTSLIYFDVNDLKKINDELGHLAGDAALKHVADIILSSIRQSDVAARLGGDEFAVVLPNAEEDAAHAKAVALADAIYNTPFRWEGREMHIKVAHGAYSFRPGEDAAKALAEADRKMYAHKKHIKGEAQPEQPQAKQ
ncbi:MAG: GGDEF domain-containing protein [Alphaproteobacteria bacterium]|nr:MAG: GGDEF domain-containing protein [Alphaproteobacteria bacterium]